MEDYKNQLARLTDNANKLSDEIKDLADLIQRTTPIYMGKESVEAVANAINDFIREMINNLDAVTVDNPDSGEYELCFDTYDNSICVNEITVDCADAISDSFDYGTHTLTEVIENALIPFMPKPTEEEVSEEVSEE